MKNTFILLSILFFSNCKAQTVVPLDGSGPAESGYYYKDINNFLNTFEGTYLYTNGNTSFKIVLQKKVMSNVNDIYYEDILIGGYQYIEDGVEKVNTLSKLSIPHVNGKFYPIDGNIIMTGKSRCPSCASDEKWVRLVIVDPIGDSVNELYVRKTIIGGQEAIRVFIYFSAFEYAVEEGAPPRIPNSYPVSTEFVFLKQ